MSKTRKELAFLRDLYIQDDWTRRFTELVDKHIDLTDSENLLYINSGTGAHALALDEKYGQKTDIFATCEDEEILHIARDKAAAVKSQVDFSMIRFEDDAFDTVLADGSFIPPDEVEAFVENAVRTAKVGGDVAVYLPSTGSFGEIFSLLWEVLFNEDLGEHGAAAEKMITELPTQTQLKNIAENLGLVNIRAETTNEIFEYDDGAAFIASPLVSDFLLPRWLETLQESEKETVSEKLSELIDSEDGNLSFRFSVKATLLTGEKTNSRL